METEFILYVASQERAKLFYQKILGLNPVLDVPGMTEFELSPGLKLGLMPESGINKILAGKTPSPTTGSGIPRCELYLKRGNVKELYQKALEAGAIAISEPANRDWGDEVGYVADPDGHIIAFAHKTY